MLFEHLLNILTLTYKLQLGKALLCMTVKDDMFVFKLCLLSR